ncbi:MAG: hypothetical protein EPO07_00835 [Verrucomicrobia bacterium]|nr:MAG: hypothetical protein EPO07_00835 [Verrucomicrobiota bacterium]
MKTSIHRQSIRSFSAAISLFLFLLLPHEVRADVSCGEVQCIGTVNFAPDIPSSANGDVNYTYEFRCWSVGGTFCVEPEPQQGPDSYGSLTLLTTQDGYVGDEHVRGNGVAEFESQWKVPCLSIYEYTHCKQSKNWLDSPPSYDPNPNPSPQDSCGYAEGAFYESLVGQDWSGFSAIIAPLGTDVSRGYDSSGNVIWELKVTKPASALPGFYSSSYVCYCGEIPSTTYDLGWSAYLKIELWVKQGNQPPSLPVGPNGVQGNGGSCQFPPSVKITSPSEGDSFVIGSNVEIDADAFDGDGSISSVAFYVDGSLLVQTGNPDTTAPYSITWNTTGYSSGSHTLTAKAKDNCNNETTSAPVHITLQGGSAPSVTLTSPTSGSVLCPGGTITLSASASDSDGTISKVEFYRGGTLIGTDYSSPYSVPWAGPQSGTCILTAKATDNSGLVKISSPVSVQVASAPVLDTEFTASANGNINDIAVQANDKIFIAGDFSQVNSTTRQNIAGLESDGTLNSSFDPSSVVADYLSGGVNCVAVDSAHKVYVGGVFDDWPNYGGRLIRLDSSGNLDQRIGTTSDFVMDADGGVITIAGGGYEQSSPDYLWVGGGFNDFFSTATHSAVDIAIGTEGTDGSVDSGFDGLQSGSTVMALIKQVDGLIAGGDVVSSYPVGDSYDYEIAWAYNSFDMDFSGGWIDMFVRALVQQSDGKILAGGDDWGYGGVLKRFNADGTVDTGFDPSLPGVVHCLLLQSNGKILAGGDFGVKRFNADGTTDSSFCACVNGTVRKLIKQSSGKVIAVGSFSQFNGQSRANIARFTP